jgi:hypothetical protein
MSNLGKDRTLTTLEVQRLHERLERMKRTGTLTDPMMWPLIAAVLKLPLPAVISVGEQWLVAATGNEGTEQRLSDGISLTPFF